MVVSSKFLLPSSGEYSCSSTRYWLTAPELREGGAQLMVRLLSEPLGEEEHLTFVTILGTEKKKQKFQAL